MRYSPSLPLGDPTADEEIAAAFSARSIAEVIYTHFSEPLIPLVPASAVRILDVGCGTGNFGDRLKRERSQCHVVGITISEAEAKRAAGRLDEVFLADMNTFDLDSLPPFDVIVCSHALGYFADTKAFLHRLRCALVPDGTLLLSVPNVVNFKERWQFMRGRFRYQERGVLEQFYLRFFDRQSLRDYVTGAGFEITYWQDEGYLPQPILRRIAPRAAAFFDRAAVKASPGFFGHTFHLAARPRISPGEQP
jgi:SAM-dependent methyltransferase